MIHESASMRMMPHNPEPKSLAQQQASLQIMRQQLEKARVAAVEALDGRFVANFATSWLVEAMLLYAFEAPLTEIVKSTETGLRELRTAMKLGFRPDSWRMWDYLLFSLAIADEESTSFFAQHATERWRDPNARPTLWLSMQIVCVVALHRQDEEHAAALLPNIHAALFDAPLPIELRPLLPRIFNEYRLVEALYRRDEGTFNEQMDERMRLREEYYRRMERSSPTSLLDLAGLGLCRLAGERGLAVRIEHVYLPLHLLAAADQRSRTPVWSPPQ